MTIPTTLTAGKYYYFVKLKVDGIDASTVLTDYALRSVGSQAILDEPHLDIADITRDGIVNAIDATSILTLYANNSVN